MSVKNRSNRIVSFLKGCLKTGSYDICQSFALQQEVDLEEFCTARYAPSVFIIMGYKDHGHPADMTVDEIMNSGSWISIDFLIPLVKAAYTKHWNSTAEFRDEALRRCINGRPFK
jgi:hypothetical protein